LRLQASRAAGEHMQALHTARLLANHGAFSALAAKGLLRTLAGEALDASHDHEQLQRAWEQLDSADRRDPLVAARAALRAGALFALQPGAQSLVGDSTNDGMHSAPPAPTQALEEARQWLRPFWDRMGELDNEQRSQVALAFMAVTRGVGNDWLPRLEAAVQSHGHDSAVSAAVGHAFAERLLWGKARRLLELAAVSATLPTPVRRQTWRKLAQLAREENDDARLLRCEQAAAALD
jgi:HemY protein